MDSKSVLASSTGAMEKNIDIVLDSRFKKLGTSWATEGANLVKLQALSYNDDWDELWSIRACQGVDFSPTI